MVPGRAAAPTLRQRNGAAPAETESVVSQTQPDSLVLWMAPANGSLITGGCCGSRMGLSVRGFEWRCNIPEASGMATLPHCSRQRFAQLFRRSDAPGVDPHSASPSAEHGAR
jgi:hypothetical protein